VLDAMALATRSQEVFNAIRDAGDPPFVEYASAKFVLFRGGEPKPVLLVVSKFHIFLFKRRTMRMYRSWPLSDCIATAGMDADGDAALTIADMRDDVELDPDEQGTDWAMVALNCESSAEIDAASVRVADIKEAAETAVEKADPLERLEMHVRRTSAGHRKHGRSAFADDDDASDSDASVTSTTSDSASPAEQAAQRSRARAAGGASATTAAQVLQQQQQRNAGAASGGNSIVASLTEGELVDFRELAEAYGSGGTAGDSELMDDLKAFVNESDRAVEAVCSEHFTAFLEATNRGAAVDTTRAASTLGDDLAKQAAAVKHSGDNITTAGKALLSSQVCHKHLGVAEAKLREVLELARLLERAEALVAKGPLEGAVRAVGALFTLAQRHQDTELGQYVLRRRHAELQLAALRQGVRELNEWLTFARDAAAPIGASIINSFAPTATAAAASGAPSASDSSTQASTRALSLSRPTRRVVSGTNGTWCVSESREPLSKNAVAAAFRARVAGLAAPPEASASAAPTTGSSLHLPAPPAAAPGDKGSAAKNAASNIAAAASASAKKSAARSDAPLGTLYTGGAVTPATESAFRVCNGSTLLSVFAAADEADTFVACVQQSRSKQLEILCSRASGIASAAAFAKHAEECVGFVVVENLLCFAPALRRLRAPLDVIASWQSVTASLLAALKRVPGLGSVFGGGGGSTSNAPDAGVDADVALAIAAILMAASASVEQHVSAVRLGTAPLRDAAGKLRDCVHADLLRSLTVQLSEAVMADPMVPITVTSAAQFADTVTVFQLHLARTYVDVGERYRGVAGGDHHIGPAPGSSRRGDTTAAAAASVPVGSGHRLPFTSMVPAVGHALLAFVTRAFDVADACATDHSADELVHEYLLVAGRTVASMLDAQLRGGGMLAGSGNATDGMLHAALMGSNAGALAVVLSVAEQRLIVRWRSAAPATEQTLGKPVLLAPVAKALSDVAARAFDRAASGAIARIEEHWAPATAAKYWYRRAAFASSRGSSSSNPLVKIGGLLAVGGGSKRKEDPAEKAQNGATAASPQRAGSISLDDSMSHAPTDATSIDGAIAAAKQPCCAVVSCNFVRETKALLEAIWTPQLVHSLVAACVMRLAEVAPDAIATAVRDADTREVLKLKPAIDDFEAEVADALQALAAEVGVRFPTNLRQHCDALRKEAEEREVAYAEEQARKLAIQAAAEAVGHGVVDGVRAAGDGAKAAAEGVANVSKATVDGVKNVGSATRRGVFGLFSRSSKPSSGSAPTPAVSPGATPPGTPRH